MRLFIAGLGYSAEAIARLAMDRGFEVFGSTRSAERAHRLRSLGIHALMLGDTLPQGITHFISSIPPQEAGDIVIPTLPSGLAWLGYLSTTGVYGDWQGAWVDENSELRGGNARLTRRIEAEGLWRKEGGHIFRLAGIYGTGRNVIDDILAGAARRIDKPGQVFSRIHVEDIAQAVLASMLNPNPGNAYNLCDDEPAPAHEVVAYGCSLLGVKPPPLVAFTDAEFSPMGREFYSANRRVKNNKIKEELRVCLHYPTYREGLAQCLLVKHVE